MQLFAVKARLFLQKILHKPPFLCNIRPKFCIELRFCKHAKFSKVNAAEKFGVDFFSPLARFFARFERNLLKDNVLLKSLKTRLFSSKSFLAQNF